jgi:Ca2+-binding RTX toxin-like protein
MIRNEKFQGEKQMFNRIGTGISIKQTTPTEVQENTPTQEQAQVPVAPAQPVVASDISQMKSGLQLYGSLQRASLFKQLEKPALTAEQAQKEVSFELQRVLSPLTRDDYRAYSKTFEPLLNRTLTTTSSDEVIDINKDQDGIVRVYVNGKESWTGTEKQFQSLIIDTGAGDDVVHDNVGNATIVTGDGNDRVYLNASYSTVETGDGDDVVDIAGDTLGEQGFNVINTGSGNDTVYGGGPPSLWTPGWRSTDGNRIDLGDGDDSVSLVGQDNIINTGEGADEVYASPSYEDGSNKVDGEKKY